MCTFGRVAFAKANAFLRTPSKETTAAPKKDLNIQGRLPALSPVTAKNLIDRAQIKSLAQQHTKKAIGYAFSFFLLGAALAIGTIIVCSLISNPIALFIVLLPLLAANCVIGTVGGLALANKIKFHAEVAFLSWAIVKNVSPEAASA